MGGNEFLARDGFAGWGCVGTLAINKEDFDQAMRFPGMGRPAYDVLFGMGGPAPQIGHRLLDVANFRKS